MRKKINAIVIVTLFIGINLTTITEGSFIKNENIQFIENNEALNEILFDKYIKILMKIAHKPSIVYGLIKNDTLVWSKTYGYYDIKNRKPATEDILYLQASISKPVSATALMQLYEKGLFKLDDDINKFIPFELRNPNHPDVPITFKMLLSHRSSLASDNNYWLCISYLPGDPDVPDWPYPWLKEYLTPNGKAYNSNVWTKDKPGVKFYYANVGYSLIGYLVEIISGQSFNDYCKEHIFSPLHMHNTSFRLRDINISRTAIPYDFKNNRYHAHPHYGNYIIHPAASLRTSLEEFSHFLIAHMNDGIWNGVRILNESTVDLMQKDHYFPNIKSKYGFGWVIKIDKFGNKDVSHSGGWPGVDTLAIIKTNDDKGIIIFTNRQYPPTKLERIAYVLIKNALYNKATRIV
jgi:CubicO group peptidase (beta-lactamase class C family)